MNAIGTITYKNQLTLPVKVLQQAGIKKSRKVLIQVKKGELSITPIASTVDSLAGSLKHFAKTGNKTGVREKTKHIITRRVASEGM